LDQFKGKMLNKENVKISISVVHVVQCKG
jgi:hypothetical protein